MKIEINFIDDRPFRDQLKAVDKYIKKFTEESPYKIEETGKRTGYYIESERYNYHVGCYKTKGGTYKFSLWLAV